MSAPLDTLRSTRRYEFAVGAIVVVALGLRLFRLGASSFWLDEINVLSFVRSGHLLGDLRARGGPFEPPLHYIAVWLATMLPIGFETAARIPAALFGVLEVLGIVLLAKELTRRRLIALTAGLFLAVAPFAVRYSQENRYYTTFSALHLVSWWLLLRALRLKTRSAFMWWAVCGAALLLAHPFAPFVILVQLAVMVSVRIRVRDRSGRPSTASMVLGLAVLLGLALPWFVWGAIQWVPNLVHGQSYALNRAARAPVQLDADLIRRVMEWLLGNSGRVDLLVGLLALLIVGSLWVARGHLRDIAVMVTAYCFAFFLALVLLTRVVNTYLAVRRVEFLLAPGLLLAAIGLIAWLDRLGPADVGRRARRLTAGGLVIVLSLIGTAAYYTTEKSDYRSLATVVDAASSRDLVVVGPVDSRWVGSIHRYLDWKGVHHDLRVITFGEAPPRLELPKGHVIWITGSPPGGRTFHTVSLNSLLDMQVIAGDRTAGGAILPWFVSTSRPDTSRALHRQLSRIRRLSVLLPPPPSSTFPWWLFTGR